MSACTARSMKLQMSNIHAPLQPKTAEKARQCLFLLQLLNGWRIPCKQHDFFIVPGHSHHAFEFQTDFLEEFD